MALPLSLVPAGGTMAWPWECPAALVLGEAVRWQVPFGGRAHVEPGAGPGQRTVAGHRGARGVRLGVIALVGVGAVIVERLCAREWCAVSWPAVAAIAAPIAALAWPATTVDAHRHGGRRAGRAANWAPTSTRRSAACGCGTSTPPTPGRAMPTSWCGARAATSADGPLEASDPPGRDLGSAGRKWRDTVLIANFYERADGRRAVPQRHGRHRPPPRAWQIATTRRTWCPSANTCRCAAWWNRSPTCR